MILRNQLGAKGGSAFVFIRRDDVTVHGVAFLHVGCDALAPIGATFVVKVNGHELLECQTECGEEGTIVAMCVGLDHQDS